MESFGDRDIGQGSVGAALVGARMNTRGQAREGNASGGTAKEFQRRDAGAAGDASMSGTSAPRGRYPRARRHDTRCHAGT